MTNRLLVRLFLLWVALDLICLVLGLWRNWFFGAAVHGLVIDFILGILVLGQCLRERGQL